MANRQIVTDKLIIEKTGKPLEHWFGIVDRKGGRAQSPQELYRTVSSIPALEPLGEWNRNLLATTYAWSRGIRERGERKDGFEVSVSKTVSAAIDVLYTAWIDDALRFSWLGSGKITIRKATKNKSARITWSDAVTSLSVDFYPKGAAKSQVVVQHQKLASKDDAVRAKAFWSEKLENLKTMLSENPDSGDSRLQIQTGRRSRP